MGKIDKYLPLIKEWQSQGIEIERRRGKEIRSQQSNSLHEGSREQGIAEIEVAYTGL